MKHWQLFHPATGRVLASYPGAVGESIEAAKARVLRLWAYPTLKDVGHALGVPADSCGEIELREASRFS